MPILNILGSALCVAGSVNCFAKGEPIFGAVLVFLAVLNGVCIYHERKGNATTGRQGP